MARDNGSGELPRERLLEKGPDALTDAELLAVLVQHGVPGYSAVEISKRLLEKLQGLTGLLHASPSTLCQIGIGRVKQAKLLASVEIARRMTAGKLPGHPLERPDAVVHHVRMHYERRDQEVLGVLYLNSRNQLIGEEELYRGTISRLVAESRLILRNALERGASGIIIFHTHPSGDPSPSSDDMCFTRSVRAAGEVLGIVLVDHLIVGASGGGWISMRDRGAW